MMTWISLDKRILVTGGAGFLGSRTSWSSFASAELRQVFAPRRARVRSHPRRRHRAPLRRTSAPRSSSTCAAVVGGIGANRANPGRFFYDNAIMGIQLIEACRRYAVEKTGGARHHLRLPQVHPGPLPRRGPLERLPRGDQCALRHRQEGAARAVPGLPPAVRHERHLPAPRQSLRPRRQLRSGILPRHPRPDPQVRRGGQTRTARRSSAGATARPPASSSTSRTPPTASSPPPNSTTNPNRSTSAAASRSRSATSPAR